MRLPQVWFYSPSTVYPELISRHIKDLELRKKLTCHWEVIVCPHTEGGTTIFQIKPASQISHVQASELGKLQYDFRAIAESLDTSVRQLARKMLAELGE